MTAKFWLAIAGILITCLIVVAIVVKSDAKSDHIVDSGHVVSTDRCNEYIPTVRQQHWKYFGLEYPYWYGVSQLQVESGCRPDITSFDEGQGIAQFMRNTEEGVERDLGEELNMYNPDQAIRAQAFYMHQLHQQNWTGKLWLTYCFYNSGYGTMRKEYLRAGSSDYAKMKNNCRRNVIVLSSGTTLDLCEVGYSYPIKIDKKAIPYRLFDDKNWKFW
jgi:hypothetical protein